MLRSYLSTAWRALWRRPGSTAINVFGLATSLAICLVLLLFIRQQWQVDRFHPQDDQIHRVTTTVEGRRYATSPAPLAPALSREAPAIGAAARLRRAGSVVEREAVGERPERSFDVRTFWAGPSFFEVFSGFQLAEGHGPSALAEPQSVVLTQAAARRIFGSASPVGRTLRRGGAGTPFTVTGILAEPEGATHLRFDALFSRASLPEEPVQTADWAGTPDQWTYLRLREDADPEALAVQASALFERHLPAEDAERHSAQMQPLSQVRFGEKVAYEITPGLNLPGFAYYALGALGLLILVASGINYVNLAVARSLRRAKEIGVRRAMGALRGQVAAQFLAEALVVALAATALACLLARGLVPLFNNLYFVGSFLDIEPLAFRPFQEPGVLLLALGLGGVVGLAAGAYPALVLSGFRPVEVMGGKGNRRSRRAGVLPLRRTLLVAQFALTLLLLIVSWTMVRQARFMKTSDYGFDTERLVNVRLQDVPYETLRQRAANLPGVEMVTGVDPLPLRGGTVSYQMHRASASGAARTPVRTYYTAVDTGFVADMGIQMVAQANQVPFASGESVLLNEAAVRVLGFGSAQEALGQAVTLGRDGGEDYGTFTVAGVVGNYHFQNKLLRVGPMVLHYAPERFDDLLVRVAGGTSLAATQAALGNEWASLDTAYPFEARPFSDVLATKYGVIEDAGRIFTAVALLAVVIACLGLLGLVAYLVETRVKEIGIRKALGASAGDVVWLFSKDFALLVPLALAGATPVAWLLSSRLLGLFAYHVDLGASVFLASGAGLLALTVLLVGLQSLRAARTNPAEVLRDE